MKKIIITLLALITISCASNKQDIQVCFTPGMDCESLIIQEIKQAKDNIYIQAYSFTDANIANALVEAHKQHNVYINVILDKTQRNSFIAHLLQSYGTQVLIDDKVAIAHNKVIIIDKKEVITGSYNFTEAAQKRNAENLLIIKDPKIAHEYLQNWFRRFEVSRTLSLEDIESKDLLNKKEVN